MNIHWLLRLAHWARHPPSPRHMAMIAGVIIACLLLVGIEYFWGWPDALRVTPGGRGALLR
ncbi:hypothetical protein [Limimaricola hongkongensis]|uniref:Uncharacterized protein n=1 Tax=Limimaricola hongkongensis DSM 17492 TaxID=1122180 RepID=A0A017HBM9_9RHOB|nr:hypothetical protein [Limimaricola hongkongensis]EYD71912.1 hypothetical protein Lokhon_01983 [Limimaricola hongkongensis DSM 17492]